MKNDLTEFEKNLLRIINVINGTHYNYRHLMEWSNSKELVENNMREGEVMYEALGVFVAIKKELSKPQTT